MAACGDSFTVAVTEDGELIAWDSHGHVDLWHGRHGHPRLWQVGLEAVLQQQEPALAGGPERFCNQRMCLAAAGRHHLAVVAEDGALFTCVYDRVYTSYGQLGLGEKGPRSLLTRVPQAVFAGSRVVMVSCGGGHTMAVTAAGHAWTCGCNDCGQLGVGNSTKRTHKLGFTQVDAWQLGGARIVMAACGARHSVVVSAEGRVWTFGCGKFGCLGHNDEQNRLVPTLVPPAKFEDSKIVTVAAAAGGAHNIAVGENGELWAWGLGSFGQLGLGDINKRLVPTLVGEEQDTVFGGSKVRMVATSFAHTLVVTEAGELWACGQGAHGRLGLHDWQDRLVPTRVDPKHFAHELISAVAAGFYHSAAVTAGGALYTWGKGEAGNPGWAKAAGHDLANKVVWLVPTLVPRQLLGGARVGRCHGLIEELALAFAMGTHERLGAGSAAGREEEGCPYLMMPADLVKQVVEACGWRAEGELGEGVVRLMGGRRTSGEV
jgi:alpha-tubulin suppressor-like RCC1 family protein